MDRKNIEKRSSAPVPISTEFSSLVKILRRCADEAPRLLYRDRDPVRCPHSYGDPEDREVAALVAALLAFGRVEAFFPALEALLDRMGPSPRRYIEKFHPRKDRPFFSAFRLRIWDGDSLRYLFANLRELFREYGSLEGAFLSAGAEGHGVDLEEERYSRQRMRIQGLADLLRRVPAEPWTGLSDPPPSYRNLVVDPSRGSACKRWNLFLRWVVRPSDGVDLGLWRGASPGDLVIPLDVHVGRISYQIGLRTRRTLDWRAAVEVTRGLWAIDPDDPLRFDLPLSHLGISGGCRGRCVPRICDPCGLKSLCTVYAGSR